MTHDYYRDFHITARDSELDQNLSGDFQNIFSSDLNDLLIN